ncbi:hypothetical protein [Rhodoferax sp.]|uniref:hypothetical protein n=1 Tax=Rhodoferax sp. TaxID=50421 RepID=UPI002629440E|nr:hypothetical protein [Rhodoferax sp.]MDD2811387.1 hypothetical protein [Rhodoferax sp.]MDD4945214.1 hypothetical protein [Rhodoferax sp.]
MSTITFDSLKLSDRLKSAGFTADQAETVVRVIAEAQDELVTKKDLQMALDQTISPVKADLLVLKWAVGLNTALCLLILGKLFNH